MKKSYNSQFKSRVALEALRGELTIAEIAGKYQIHPNLVTQWKRKLQASASDVFMTKAERKTENKPYTEDTIAMTSSIRTTIHYFQVLSAFSHFQQPT